MQLRELARRFGVVLAAFGLSFSLVGNAMADDSVLRYAYGADSDPLNITVNGRAVGDAEVGKGSFGITEYGAGIEYKWFSMSYSRADYNWSDVGGLPFGNGSDDPWDSLQTLTFGAKADGSFTDTLGWFAGGTVISGFEEDMDGSFSLFYRGGITYRFSDEWRASLGLMGIASQLNPMAAPVIGLDWRSPRDLGWSAGLGIPATFVNYRFNDWAALRGAARWDRSQHRLADDSPVSEKGYVQQSSVTTGVYLDLSPLERLTVTVGAEYYLDREMKLYDEDRDEIDTWDVDNALGGVLRVRYSF